MVESSLSQIDIHHEEPKPLGALLLTPDQRVGPAKVFKLRQEASFAFVPNEVSKVIPWTALVIRIQVRNWESDVKEPDTQKNEKGLSASNEKSAVEPKTESVTNAKFCVVDD